MLWAAVGTLPRKAVPKVSMAAFWSMRVWWTSEVRPRASTWGFLATTMSRVLSRVVWRDWMVVAKPRAWTRVRAGLALTTPVAVLTMSCGEEG